MFVGHYGVSFAARKLEPSVPLWVLFIAVQLLDVVWAPFVLLAIEKVRIVPGFTASNPFDLYYMPYTHGLITALLWSVAAFAIYRLWRRRDGNRAAVVVGVAVFSHWILDLVVHAPDLPLYDNAAKVGFGLWDQPAIAFSLELHCYLAECGCTFALEPGVGRRPPHSVSSCSRSRRTFSLVRRRLQTRRWRSRRLSFTWHSQLSFDCWREAAGPRAQLLLSRPREEATPREVASLTRELVAAARVVRSSI